MIVYVTAALVIVADLLTKFWAAQKLAIEGRRIPVIPGCLDLYLAHNTGAAFSFLSEHPGIITLVSIAAIIMVVMWSRKIPINITSARFAMGLFIGGGIGNLIDRIRFQHVVDFIHIYYREWYWPTFNVADMAISSGIVIILYLLVFTKKLDPPQPVDDAVPVDASIPPNNIDNQREPS